MVSLIKLFCAPKRDYSANLYLRSSFAPPSVYLRSFASYGAVIKRTYSEVTVQKIIS